MKIDTAFQIGKTHDICEDFALTVNKESSVPSVLISDGCSSSPHTDVGSRILTFSAIEQLKTIVSETGSLKNFDHNVCISKAKDVARNLSMSPRSIDATLLIASVTDMVELNILGDGIVAMGMEDGSICILDCEYKQGYPFYMSYLPISSKSFKDWKENYSFGRICPSVIHNGIHNTHIENEHDSNWQCATDYFITDEGKANVHIVSDDWNMRICVELEKLKWITIMSDGIHSFYQTKNDNTSLTNVDIDYAEVLQEVLSFKNFNGKFMQRRLNRFLKFCQKNNWHHADDISFGAIYFGDK